MVTLGFGKGISNVDLIFSYAPDFKRSPFYKFELLTPPVPLPKYDYEECLKHVGYLREHKLLQLAQFCFNLQGIVVPLSAGNPTNRCCNSVNLHHVETDMPQPSVHKEIVKLLVYGKSVGQIYFSANHYGWKLPQPYRRES